MGTDDSDCGTGRVETTVDFSGPASCPIPEACCSSKISLILTGLDSYKSEVKWKLDGGEEENAEGDSWGPGTEIALDEDLSAHTFEFMDQYADGWGTGATWELVDTCGNTVAAGPGPSDGYADWISVPFGGAGAACPTCQPVDCAGAWGAWAAAGIPGDSCTWAGDDACDVPGAKVYC